MNALRRHLDWLPLAGLAAILAGVLVFVYSRTQGYDGAAYFEDVAQLRSIGQLDAQWELDALKAKIGINSNYDPLAEHLRELDRQRQRLAATIAGQEHAESAALAGGIAAFSAALEEKSQLVEQFKSHNAVLRNSLAFLPTAAADVERAAKAGGGRPAVPEIAAAVHRLLQDSLVHSQAASDELAAGIEADLGRLDGMRRAAPAAVGKRLDIFTGHAAAVLREQRTVSGLLERIAAVPVAARVDDINRLLDGEQAAAAARAHHYRLYLLVFAVLLLALLAYAAASLIDSHAEIRRVNRELHAANAGLEARVEERTHELRAAQAEVVATAHRAGMAEIATNVLHNVGNVLNSVNISAGVVGERIRASKAQGLAKAVQMLDEHPDDLGDFLTRDARGRLLPGYLARLADALAAEQADVVAELGQLAKSIDHIKDIVATQQSYTGAQRLLEPVEPRELVEDALRMNAAALSRHEVTVVKEFADLPALPLDRHRVLQILVNLISNAKHAMDGVAGRAHRLTLRVDTADGAAGRRLRIAVADVGEGIPAENLGRIFAHGFTTRKDGHGFGLHSAAIAAREMGGTLTAESDGPGLGAVFTLELPIPAG